MKIGFFILYGFIVFVISVAEFFTLNGGIVVMRDDQGFKKFKIAGEVGVRGWVTSAVLALCAGFLASIASSAGWAGLLVLVITLGLMGGVTYYACKEVSTPMETLIVLALLVALFFISKMGAIASGALIHVIVVVNILIALSGMCLAVCIGILISSVLKYRASGGHLMKGKMPTGEAQTYTNLSYAALATAAIIAVVILVVAIV